LLLLVSFSLGLALVLMAIGILVIYAKNLLPSSSGGNPFFRWMPVASAAVVMLLGVVMTGVSLGWIQPHWMAG
jgi:nickel/cobalt exporter